MNINNRKEERNLEVLTHIIKMYVSAAMPVSSSAVAEKMGNNISSATIRNIMAELEESGYIEQPHTSAGRVPTDLGYRKYVNSVKDKLAIETRKAESLAREYAERMKSIRQIVEKTSNLISRELHQAGVAMCPSLDDSYLKHLELVRLQAETVLAVLVTMTNDVRNYIIKMGRDIQKAELEKVSNYINSKYEEASISEIHGGIKENIRYPESAEILKTAKTAMEIMDVIVESDMSENVYYDGLNNFVETGKYNDSDIARRMLKIFADKKAIYSLLRHDLPYSGVRIYIGTENSTDMLRGCGIVTSGYSSRGRIIGRIGVIGSTRMDYERVIKTVNYLSQLISLKLDEIEG